MKRALIMGATIGIFAMAQTASAGSVRIYNSDSKTHTVELRCSGSSKSMDVKGSTTSTYTFHSTNSSCEIAGGSVSFPASKLNNGDSWKISGSRASRN